MRAVQCGQAVTEYLVALAFVVALLAMPVDGHASLAAMWQAAVRTAYARFLFALAGLV